MPPQRSSAMNDIRAAFSQNLARTLVLGLAILLLLFIVGYPIVWLLLGAFGFPAELGLGSFVQAYSRSQNFVTLKNTLVLTIGASLLSVVFGVPLAWATAKTDMPLRRVIQALVALAYITPAYLTALACIILLGPEAGYLNRLAVSLFGLEKGPFNAFSMGGVTLVVATHVFAFTYFLTHAALCSIDTSLEQSAQILGLGRLGVIWHITLPLVLPAISGGAILAAIEAMSSFGPQAFLGLPAQIVFLPTRIYAVMNTYPPRFGEASALSLILVALTVLMLVVQRSYLDRRSYVTVTGRSGSAQTIALGGWRWPVFAACFAIVAIASIAPIVVLVVTSFSVSWIDRFGLDNVTLENFRIALVEDSLAVRGIYNSFRLAGIAALAATAIGLFIAYTDVRTKWRGRALLDYLAILPLGLPGTVMAVGVLMAFIRPPLVLYGTVWILLIAYTARLLPLSVRVTNGTLRQIDPSLEEAARISGASWLGAIRHVLLPLAWRGIVVAFLLAFIPALSELSATILLYTSRTETIAIAMFTLNEQGRLEVVAALAVFTIGIILAFSMLLNWVSTERGAAPPAAS